VPYADPCASFDSAVRHLFRYLNHPQRLRQNPLVRHFFEAPKGAPVTSVGARDRSALALIHRLVREGADRCRDDDLATSRYKRAMSGHTIVLLNCLQGVPLKSVAARLGISPPQCYRERAALCRRIAKHIQHYADTPASDIVSVLDEFRTRMYRATIRFDVGDFDGAIHDYNELLRSSSIPGKIEALCRSAMAFAEQGLLRQATDATSSAHMLFEANRASLPSQKQEVARAQIELAWWRMAAETLNGADCVDAIDAAASRLSSIQATADDATKELYAEILVNRSWTRRNFGDSTSGEDPDLSEAAEILHQVHAPMPVRSLRVALILERVRNGGMTDTSRWRPARMRLEALSDLSKRARALGSLDLNMSAALGFVEYGAQIGNVDLAWDSARYSLSIAKQHPNRCFRARIAIHVAGVLTYTKHWHHVRTLLGAVDRNAATDVRRDIVDFLEARCYLRLGAYGQAWSLATAPWRAEDSPLCAARMSAVAASAADALDRHRDATNLIEEAVSKLEGIRSVLPLRDGYAAAAEITGSSQFLRKAEDLTRLLTT
jgi:tetratricopeptide (TPR) repeat protein